MNELDVIRMSTLKNNVLILPQNQLERSLYVRVKNVLEGIGGKWDRKHQGFIFMHNPKPLLDKILKKGIKINIKKDYQLFETPPVLVKQMIQLANIRPTDKILEPSAGRGRIVDHLPKGRIAVMELMPENRQILKIKGYNIIGNDFLKLPLKIKFDKIIANPPFAKDQDIDHILKMYEHLAPNGRLISLASPGWTFKSYKKPTAFREFLNKVHAQVRYIPEKTFQESGTTVQSTMIIIDKKPFPANPLKRNYSEWIREERSKNTPPIKEEESIDLKKSWAEMEQLQVESRKSHAKLKRTMKEM